jgi:threonine dehydrogenase-like Zn-dependent dehydrogenase
MSLGLHAVPAGPELHAHIKEKTFGEGVDLVLDCAAVPATAIEMTSLVRPRGIIVVLGVFKKPVAVDMQAINFKELTMLGSRVYTRHDFLEAIALARDLPLEKIVTHSFTLSEVREAFNRFESGDNACKVLVFPNGSSEVNLVET